MLHRRLFVLLVPLAVVACAGDNDKGGDPTAVPGVLDLAAGGAVATISFPPGDIQPGWPWTIASGDFNNDGATDLLLGAPLADGPDDARDDAGEAYVLFGPVEGDVGLASDAADVVILGAKPGDSLGSGVAVGDLNADGVDDIVVGASASDAIRAIRTDMGEVYVVFGGRDLGGTIDLLEEQQDVTFQPAEGFSQLGRAMAIGDVNGDGVDDLVAGAPYAGREPGSPPGGVRTTTGEVYIFYGREGLGGTVTVANGGEDVRIAGLTSYDQFGGSVAVADADGEPPLDVIVGASGYDGPDGVSPEGGGVFVFRGGPDLPHVIGLSEAELSLTGAAGETLGATLSAGDEAGVPVIVAGAPTATGLSVPSTGVGKVYIARAQDLTADGDVTSCSCSVVAGASAGGFFPATVALSSSGVAAMSYPTDSPLRRPGSGSVLVSSGLPVETDLAVSVEGLLLIAGEQAGAGLGSALAFADLDGDGQEELLIQSAPADGAAGSSVVYAVSLPY